MTTRRNFLKTGGLSLASLMVGQHSFARMAEKADDKLAGAASTTQYVCKRPVPSKRQFTSEAVEKAIATTKAATAAGRRPAPAYGRSSRGIRPATPSSSV